MSALVIDELGDDLEAALRNVAALSERTPSDTARDLIAHALAAPPSVLPTRLLSDEERARRDALVADLRAIRACTEKPLQMDSTLVIREMRDIDE